MAAIHETIENFQVDLVLRALRRAPTEARMANGVLDSLRQQLVGPYGRWRIPGGRVWWTALRRSFGIGRDHPNAATKIAEVRRVYHGACRIIRSRDCVITRTSEGWGYAPVREGAIPPYQYEIRVGPEFLSGNAGNYSGVSGRCPAPNDTGILRATTLIHEAIHWLQDILGHSSVGMLSDPFNYEFFIFQIRCMPPASVIDEYRLEPVAARDHRSTGVGRPRNITRYRTPGPIGLG